MKDHNKPNAAEDFPRQQREKAPQTKEFKQINMEDIDKGVYYTPSTEGEELRDKHFSSSLDFENEDFDLGGFNLKNEFEGRREQRDLHPEPKPQTMREMAPYMIATLVVGVVVVGVAFALAFRTLQDNSIIPPVDSSHASLIDPVAEDKTVETFIPYESVFVLLTLSENAGILTVLELSTEAEMMVTVTDETKISDKYGGKIRLSDINLGEILELELTEDKKEVTSIHVSSEAFNYYEIAGVEVIVEDKLLIYGNDRLIFNDHTLFLYGELPFLPEDISEADTLSLRGFGEQVYQVELTKGHGYMHMGVNEEIINGTVEIDFDIRKPLAEVTDTELPLSEGEHQVVIKGDNIKEFSSIITVLKDTTEEFLLDEIEFTSGNLQVIIAEAGVQLLVNDVIMNYAAPIALPYGDYTLTASKEGFTAKESQVSINKALVEVTITMEKLVEVANISIDSIPTDAMVYLDNIYQGSTPISTTAEFGDHVLTFYKDGYEESVIPIHVEQKDFSINVQLQEKVPVMN